MKNKSFTIFSDESGSYLEFMEKNGLVHEGPFETKTEARRSGENRGWDYLEYRKR